MDFYHKSLQVLKELKKKYPSFELGRNLASATADYSDIWGLPDKELYHALLKYQETVELNNPYPVEEEIEKILRDGLDLREDQDEEDY